MFSRLVHRVRNMPLQTAHNIAIGTGAVVGGNIAAYKAVQYDFPVSVFLFSVTGTIVGAGVGLASPVLVPAGVVAAICTAPAYMYGKWKHAQKVTK